MILQDKDNLGKEGRNVSESGTLEMEREMEGEKGKDGKKNIQYIYV